MASTCRASSPCSASTSGWTTSTSNTGSAGGRGPPARARARVFVSLLCVCVLVAAWVPPRLLAPSGGFSSRYGCPLILVTITSISSRLGARVAFCCSMVLRLGNRGRSLIEISSNGERRAAAGDARPVGGRWLRVWSGTGRRSRLGRRRSRHTATIRGPLLHGFWCVVRLDHHNAAAPLMSGVPHHPGCVERPRGRRARQPSEGWPSRPARTRRRAERDGCHGPRAP